MNLSDIPTKQDLVTLKQELLKEILPLLKGKSPDQKPYLKSSGVRKLLSCSATTLQTLRVTRKLPYSKVSGTLYYKYEDVVALLNQSTEK